MSYEDETWYMDSNNQPLGIWMIPCKCKIWYTKNNKWVNFSKFSQVWAKISSNLRTFLNNRVILLKNLVQNQSDWYMNGSVLLKIGFCMGLLSNLAVAHTYQNQTWVPPSPWPIITPNLVAVHSFSPYFRTVAQSYQNVSWVSPCPGIEKSTGTSFYSNFWSSVINKLKNNFHFQIRLLFNSFHNFWLTSLQVFIMPLEAIFSIFPWIITRDTNRPMIFFFFFFFESSTRQKQLLVGQCISAITNFNNHNSFAATAKMILSRLTPFQTSCNGLYHHIPHYHFLVCALLLFSNFWGSPISGETGSPRVYQ